MGRRLIDSSRKHRVGARTRCWLEARWLKARWLEAPAGCF